MMIAYDQCFNIRSSDTKTVYFTVFLKDGQVFLIDASQMENDEDMARHYAEDQFSDLPVTLKTWSGEEVLRHGKWEKMQ